ncbi:MAG TPA: ATP-binding protein [Myxococcota bacterium]|nr:ATP-binding protein [Myxococcota bacterium]HRY95201.1 ATP-binding protein [Myxococcota bacterium]HSA20514.1 ATP-binding protein [Myxococcota bacterium]
MSPEAGYTLAAEGALASLVSQFSSRLDCFRELVQNSIDAGSRRIDVRLEWEPGAGGQGTSAIHVWDDGEGMTAAIIDQELTRLFASSKEDDLTKIGKFGIGFVSIFALAPRAVLVHTGRQGEAWEVLFHEDRSYDRLPLPTACEGTRITLFVPGDAARHAELAAGAREALWRWCRFTPVALWFEDRASGRPAELIRAPFAVEGECPVRVEAEGMELALAWSECPTHGFYNRGLTLLETADTDEAVGARAALFRRVSFRARADKLEHTLSRETVYRDENLARVLEALEAAVCGPLADALADELERLAALPAPGPLELGRGLRLLAFLSAAPFEVLRRLEDRPLLAAHDGPPRSLADVWATARQGPVALGAERTAVAEALHAQGGFCLREGPEGQVRRLLLRYLLERERRSALGVLSTLFGLDLRADAGRPRDWLGYHPEERLGARLVAPEDGYLAVELLPAPGPDALALLAAAQALLAGAGVGFRELGACRLRDPLPEPPLLLQGPRLTPLMPRAWLRPRGPEQAWPVAAVNLEHPQARACLAAQPVQPRVAACALARALALASAEAPLSVEALLGAAADRRGGGAG